MRGPQGGQELSWDVQVRGSLRGDLIRVGDLVESEVRHGSWRDRPEFRTEVGAFTVRRKDAPRKIVIRVKRRGCAIARIQLRPRAANSVDYIRIAFSPGRDPTACLPFLLAIPMLCPLVSLAETGSIRIGDYEIVPDSAFFLASLVTVVPAYLLGVALRGVLGSVLGIDERRNLVMTQWVAADVASALDRPIEADSEEAGSPVRGESSDRSGGM